MIPNARDSVLLIEHHAPVAHRLASGLEANGLQVVCITSAWLQSFAPSVWYDAVVIGSVELGWDAEALCRQLRRRGVAVPILVLTGQHDLSQRIALLDAGADAYLDRSVDVRELVGRLHACLRQTRRKMSPALLCWEDLTIDLDCMAVSRAGQPLQVKPMGLRILAALVRQAPHPVRRQDLYRRVWAAGEAPQHGSLRSHMSQLRAAVDRNFERALIQTVRAGGYRLSARSEHPF